MAQIMSDSVRHHSSDGQASTRTRRGQSLVEFALLLPLLLVLLLGIADFGRVFQAGIVMESASRAAAEAGAVEYLRVVADKGPSDAVTQSDYDHVRAVAIEIACKEARLPNADPDADCSQGPAIRVCIHDAAGNTPGGGDANCGDSGLAAIPADCWKVTDATDVMNPASGLTVMPTDANPFPRGAYVEVRTCYRFTTLFNLNLPLPMNTGLSLGEIYLQRESNFTVADY